MSLKRAVLYRLQWQSEEMLRKAGGASVLAVHTACTPWSLLRPAFVCSHLPQTLQSVVLTCPKCKVPLGRVKLSASLSVSLDTQTAACAVCQHNTTMFRRRMLVFADALYL